MDVPDLSSVPVQTQLRIVQAYLAFKIVGQVYSSVRNGGGVLRILKSFWFGENLPAPVARDYHEELASPPKDPNPSQL